MCRKWYLTALSGSDIRLEAGIKSQLVTATVNAAGPSGQLAVHADEA